MWLGLGLGLGFMMPLKTWPVARRQQSGMMGLLVERSSSNCTTVAAYAMKYGELATPLPFEPNAILATLLVLGIPAGVAYNFYSKEPLLSD